MTTIEKLAEIAARAAVTKPATIVAKKGDAATLYLYDAITPAGMGGISAKDVIDALEDAKDAKELTIRVNSPGGAYYEAKAIYATLRAHPAHKTVHVDGLAASAATFIAMAADRIVTAPEATWMIHNAQGLAVGDANAMREIADLLDMESGNIAAIYAKRTGQTVEDLRAWMDAETFMTAQEAKERGFTDAIDGEEEEEKPMPRRVAASAAPFVSLQNETSRRIAEARNARVESMRRQQERSRASAGATPGQPGRK
jgi:ATP-dependent protease ClpP protease subunit